MYTLRYLLLTSGIIFILVACGGTPIETPDPNITSSKLLLELQQHNITPKAVGISKIEWLQPAPGIAYQLTSDPSQERVYIHTYPDIKAAEDIKSRITRQINIDMTDWTDSPHFFQCANYIILYLGKDDKVLSILTTACGPQFAGKN
jgi:hypothetical protein